MNNSDISVLLVDDDEMVRECLSAYLEDEGFSIYSAASGEDALNSIADINPVVCISDMRLPGMNGDEFIRQAHLVSPVTRFLLHTGAQYLLSEDLTALGMKPSDVLLKPIYNLSTLVDKIRNIARRRDNQ